MENRIHFTYQRFNFMLFFALILFFSCKTESKYVDVINVKEFSNDSFDKEIVLSHQLVNDEFIGDPLRLTLIDSMLFAVDSKTDTIVHTFSTTNNAYLGSIISRGNGPEELLSIGIICPSIENKTFWAYDITSKKWVEFGLKDTTQSNNHLVTRQIIRFTNNMFNNLIVEDPTWLSDSLFICRSLNNYKERFFIFDKKLNLSASISNPNLVFDERVSNGILSDLFATLFDVKPDRKKIVLVGRYFNLIEIYNVDGRLHTQIKGPDNNMAIKFNEEKSYSRGVLIKSPETRKLYICVQATNDGIYALYSGKERQDISDYSCSNVIYKFDWDGKPITKYILDIPIASFDIDKKKIYAIAKPQNSIVSFDLN